MYYKEINATDEQLREWGMTYDDAYFMAYGDYPRHKWGNTCKPPIYDDHDNEQADNAYREYIEANFYNYFEPKKTSYWIYGI